MQEKFVHKYIQIRQILILITWFIWITTFSRPQRWLLEKPFIIREHHVSKWINETERYTMHHTTAHSAGRPSRERRTNVCAISITISFRCARYKIIARCINCTETQSHRQLTPIPAFRLDCGHLLYSEQQ